MKKPEKKTVVELRVAFELPEGWSKKAHARDFVIDAIGKMARQTCQPEIAKSLKVQFV